MGYIYVYQISGQPWIKVGSTKWCSRSRMEEYELRHRFKAEEGTLHEVELPAGADPEAVEFELQEKLEKEHGFAHVPLNSSMEIYEPPKDMGNTHLFQGPYDPTASFSRMWCFVKVKELLGDILSGILGTKVEFTLHTGHAKFSPKSGLPVDEQAHSRSVDIAANRLANPEEWKAGQLHGYRGSSQSMGADIFTTVLWVIAILAGLKSCIF